MVALFVRKYGVPRLTHHVYKKGRSAESIRTAKVLLIALLTAEGLRLPLEATVPLPAWLEPDGVLRRLASCRGLNISPLGGETAI